MFYVTVCYLCETVILCYPVLIFWNDNPDRAPRGRLVNTHITMLYWLGRSRSWRKQSVFITHPSPGVQTLLESLMEELLKQPSSLCSENTVGTMQAAECSPAPLSCPPPLPQQFPPRKLPPRVFFFSRNCPNPAASSNVAGFGGWFSASSDASEQPLLIVKEISAVLGGWLWWRW